MMTQRGYGRTARQITCVALNGIFVVRSGSETYMQALAKHLGRDDVRVVSISSALRSFTGTRIPVTVDHAASHLCGESLIKDIERHNWFLVARSA